MERSSVSREQLIGKPGCSLEADGKMVGKMIKW